MAAPTGYTELTITGRFDPVPAAARLASAGLHDTYVVYEREGTCAFAGGALGEVTVHGQQVWTRWRDTVEATPLSDRPLRQIGDALAALPWPDWTGYGWVAFELATGAGAAQPDGRSLAHVVVPETEVLVGADRVRVRSVDMATIWRAYELLVDQQDEPAAGSVPQAAPIEVTGGAEDYRSAVSAAVADIRDGLLQKVILSRCVPVPFAVDVVGTFLRGRRASTPARSFVLQLGGRRAVGFSPETVLEAAADGRVSTQPLAGTRALGLGAGPDSRLRDELESDPKEIFEHAVSVKLARDELLAACDPGSVAVTEFMTVRDRGSVQHLASRVEGTLAQGRTAWDALGALFPAVTASGIPKQAAFERIARLEDRPRGLYSGAVLTAGSDGSLDAGLVLRTLFEEDGKAWLRAGAGIVAASSPQREYEETCEKLLSIAPHVVPVQRRPADPIADRNVRTYRQMSD